MEVLLKDRISFYALPSSLENKTIVKSYRKERYIFQGFESADRIFFIKEGIAKIIKFSSSGKKMIMEYKKAGDCVGLETLFQPADEIYDFSLLAVTNVKVDIIQRKDFEFFMVDSPELSMDVIRQMGTRCKTMSTLLRDYTLNDIYGKTVKTIEQLGNDYGHLIKENAMLIDLPLTNQELSHIIGSSRETVSRVMSQLKESGMISMEHKRIKIDNWSSFCLFAENY